MKITNRIQRNGATKNSRLQPANTPEAATSAQIELKDALVMMERTGNAGCAGLMLLAEKIQHDCLAFSGWESFEFPGFRPGIAELARTVIDDYNKSVEAFSSNAAGDRKLYNTDAALENAVGLLRCTITTLADIVSERAGAFENQLHHHVGNRLSEKLETAFKRLWAARADAIRQMRAEVVS